MNECYFWDQLRRKKRVSHLQFQFMSVLSGGIPLAEAGSNWRFVTAESSLNFGFTVSMYPTS